MGVTVPPATVPTGSGLAPIPPGATQDALLDAVGAEIQDKGFVVAQMDKLVN